MAAGWCTEGGVGEDAASRLFRQHILTSRCAKLTTVANWVPKLEQRGVHPLSIATPVRPAEGSYDLRVLQGF
jgi:hypothetical protein